MESLHYVYEWWRMDLNLPYYVGKGSGDRAHELSRNDHADKVTASLARNGIAREVRIIAKFLTAKAAFAYEIERIAFWWYLTEHDILTNKTKGGEGAASGDLNPQKRPEARARVSKQKKGTKDPIETCLRKAAAAKKRESEISPEKKSERHARASQGLKKAAAKKTPEERSENTRKGNITKSLKSAEEQAATSAKKSASMKKTLAAKSSEDKLKSEEKRKATLALKGEEEKAKEKANRQTAARARFIQEPKGKRTASAKKGWETRRRNKAEALAAKEKSSALC